MVLMTITLLLWYYIYIYIYMLPCHPDPYMHAYHTCSHARIPHVAFTHNTYVLHTISIIRVAALCMRQDTESCCPECVRIYTCKQCVYSQLYLILRKERSACYALVGSAIFRWVGGSGQDSTLVTRPSSFPFYHALLYANAILTPIPQVQSVCKG